MSACPRILPPLPLSTCSLGQPLLIASAVTSFLVSQILILGFHKLRFCFCFLGTDYVLNSLLSSHSVSFDPRDNSENIILVPIVQMGDRRRREVRSLAQGCSAKWSWTQDSNLKVGTFSLALVLSTKSAVTELFTQLP